MSGTAFEKWLDSISDGLGPDLPAKPEDAARTAWNAAIDAASGACDSVTLTCKARTVQNVYKYEGVKDCKAEIQKLRSE